MGVARVLEALGRKDARRKLFAPIHEKIGGRIRFFISGSAPIDPEVSRGFRKLGFGFLQGYGLTETSPIVSVNRERAFRDSSVGLPLPEVEIRIEDRDEEGIGEILVRGPNVMLGYHNDPEETSKVLRDGWLLTGDFGRLDEDGFLYVTGRKKNVIIAKNGKNVYPEEMETILNRSLLVGESMVFARKSESKGEEISAILSPDADEMIARAERAGEELSREFVAGLLAREIRAFNMAQPRFKRIASFMIYDGEMAKTTTKKIRRREVLREAGIEPERMHRV
jgi:long-chain acyl-CoA synthetase